MENSAPATKDQKQAIYRLCGYRTDIKEEFVQWATEDVAKTSCNDLTFEQANKIIVKQGGNPHRVSSWGFFDSTNQQHRQILSLCQQYGWTTKHAKTGRDIADMQKLANWLQFGKAPIKKPLKKMEPEELTKTINALNYMVGKKYK